MSNKAALTLGLGGKVQIQHRDVLIFLNFWKLLVGARFCGERAQWFFLVLHWNCLFKLYFLWCLTSQFLHVQVKNVENLAKRAHPWKARVTLT